MDTFTLPPSPNWQLSKILACNDSGLLAYGSRGEVSIIDWKPEGKFSVSFLHLAHKDKLNVVVFSPIKGKFHNCLATCGDDGMVRVWNFQDLCLLYCHSGHKDGVRVMGLDWSRADSNRLVSVNDLGIIVCWDLASNTIRRLHCGIKVLPLCLACCPHDKDLIAIGCKGGVTLIVDIKGKGKLIHRLRGNEQDVISISWCPVPYNVIKHKKNVDPKADTDYKESEEKDRDLLLATGGLEKSIFIWRTGSDGRFEVILNLPNTSMTNSSQRKKAYHGMNANMMWTCVHWVDAYTLLSTSQFAELLSWDLNKVYSYHKGGKKPQPRLLHSRHNKGCFSIACPVIYDMLSDWKETRNVWTTAMDKHIVGVSLTSGSIASDIPTLGGTVFCMALSPLDPNRLAIGSSDSKVFVWNTSDVNSLNLAAYWKNIIGKVMAVCWHPSEEDLLAYGTSDGHVGLLDLGSSKPPTLLRLHLRKTVYRVCWAPPLLKPADATSNSKLTLFAVGDGDVLQFNANPQDPNEAPKSMNSAILNSFDKNLGLQKTLARSDVAFKPGLSCFAVSSENGSVYIVSWDTLALQHTLYPHKKLINNLEWHPTTVACDNSLSPYQHWLASSCDNVKVYNIPPEGQPELVATLNGHMEKIVSLTWSPHFHGRLLSTSYDCTVQVWDVPTQACLAVCQAHATAVMCALFSPQDPDIVISGSNDNTVRFWAISQIPPSSAKLEKKKNRMESALKMRSEAEEATELTVGMFEISQNEDKTTAKHVKRTSTPDTSEQSTSSILSLGSEKGSEDFKKRHKGRVMFPVTGPQLAQARHFEVLMQRWAGDATSDDTPSPSAAELGYLDFFGDDKAIRRLLLVEESHQTQNRHFLLAQQSALLRGDVTQMIREAITKKQLTDWLISIAPLAGFDVWEEACEVYAGQLAECGEIFKASTYLLATHKVHEAVQLLVDHKQYREAVAVAKCRLASDDPLTSHVYTVWGNAAKLHGQLILAAHCFLAAGNTQDCVETLSRIKELRWLRMAAQLARRTGQAELADSLALECLSLSVTTGNLSEAHQLLASTPQYQYSSVWLRASELLAKVKNRSEKEVFAWLEGRQPGHLNLCQELSKTCASAGPIYHQLLPHLPTNKTPKFERDMWSYMSGQLAAACAAWLEATPAHFLRHTVSAVSAAFHFQTIHPSSLALPLTLSLLAPKGLFAEGSILNTECQTAEEKQLLKSLRAFACASIIHWMNNNWEKVTNLGKKSEETARTENGSGDCVKANDEYKMAWLPELLETCSVDVLDAENVQFFVKKAQKQQLQDVVNKENIQKKCIENQMECDSKRNKSKSKTETVILKTDCDSSVEKCSVGQVSSDSSNQDGTKTGDENLNVAKESQTFSEMNMSSRRLEKEHVITIENGSSQLIVKSQDKSDILDSLEKTEVPPKPSIKSENTPQSTITLTKNTNGSTIDSSITSPSPSKVNEKTPKANNVASNEDGAKTKDSNTTINPKSLKTEESIQSSKPDTDICSSDASDSILNVSTASLKTTESIQSSKPDTDILSSDESDKILNVSAALPNGSGVKNAEEDPSSRLKQIKELDEVLQKFEADRESVPSPFTAYINIMYLLENLVTKQDAKLAQKLLENCDNLWKRSQQ